MKIGFFELEPWEEKIIGESFPGENLFLSHDKITDLCLPITKDFEIISVFVDSRIDEKVLDCLPDLKCVATRSTGYDHIDLEACKKRRVTVLYVPGYGDNTVAEFAFGLILNLTRKIYQSIDRVKETGSFSLDGLRGADLKMKTIGIIGTGRIGKEMIKIAKGFDMGVLACDPYPDQVFSEKIGFKYVTLRELLENSDVVSLHCPYDAQTHHLINSENINFIKPGAYLVNTARGAIVETEALVSALNSGALSGAALDVLEEEGETKDEITLLARGHPKEKDLRTILENHALMRMSNVLITPHNAFNSKEALGRILDTTLDNVKNFIAGKPTNIIP